MSNWNTNPQNSDYDNICCGNSSNNVIGISKKSFNAVEDLKAFLQENDVYCVCELETPIITQITGETLLKQLEELINIETYHGTIHITTESTENNLLPKLKLTYKQSSKLKNKGLEEKITEIDRNLLKFLPRNAGMHNSIYRGENITELFYNGTLSREIAAGTFDNIFVGDYIIGKNSGRKYLVADINYRLYCGDTKCTTPHILMIPERSMGTAKMNDTNITTGAYTGSKMYTEYLTPFKTIIKNDFEIGHILKHKSYLANTVINGYESAGTWLESDIELMNELMVYGSNIFHNVTNGTNVPTSHTIDKSQLSLFRLDKSKIAALSDDGNRTSWWLRDVVSASGIANVDYGGRVGRNDASNSYGVRPAFLVY